MTIKTLLQNSSYLIGGMFGGVTKNPISRDDYFPLGIITTYYREDS